MLSMAKPGSPKLGEGFGQQYISHKREGILLTEEEWRSKRLWARQNSSQCSLTVLLNKSLMDKLVIYKYLFFPCLQ